MPEDESYFSGTSSHTLWIWDVGNFECSLRKALPGDGCVHMRCREDPVLALMCCLSLTAKSLSQAGTILKRWTQGAGMPLCEGWSSSAG